MGGEHVSSDSCRGQAGNRHVVQVPTEGRVGQWVHECMCGHRPEVSREQVSTGYFREGNCGSNCSSLLRTQ